ncbi:MAG: hypothetical protein AAB596_01425 [Patescibacteria group bacterium]
MILIINAINDFYSKIPRRIKIFFAFLLIVLLAYFSVRFFMPETKNIPDEFLKARQQSSVIAKEVVELSEQTSNNLKVISDLDKEKKYSEALVLISSELERSRSARSKAIGLSVQLEIMAKNISVISPASASQAALMAVSSETTLISRLIAYNEYLVQLLSVLQNKFLGKTEGSNGKIAELLVKINEEARTINQLNANFNDLMIAFDEK